MRSGYKEKIALIFLSFWLTILGIRSWLFDAWRDHGQYPAIMIHGVHIHHFAIGFILILLAGALYLRSRLKRELLTLFLFGAGLGLIFDEFSFWTRLQFNYWGLENFLATALTGLVLFVLALIPERQKTMDPANWQPHFNPAQPSVSVVIPAFNEEKFLANSLEAVLAQDYQNFELIVVNNASTDRTAAIARRAGAKIINEQRRGVGYARQAGFLAAKGRLVATTDADTVVPADWLTRIVKEFNDDNKLAAFGGLYFLNSGSLIARIAVAYFAYPLFLLDKTTTHGWSIPGANLAVRRSAFTDGCRTAGSLRI